MEKIKVPGTDVEVRVTKPPEKIELVAHSADCRYCDGIVKMPRDGKGKLQPDKCWCLLCGQHYFVEINEPIDQWEYRQWKQKSEL